MKSKLLHDRSGERTFALVFDSGDDPNALLLDFARRERLRAGRITGLGGFSRVTLGYFEMDRKDYKPIAVNEQVEVVSFIGNVSLYEGEPRLHIHVTIGRSDGSSMSGHLLDARVQPTLELMVVDSPSMLERAKDQRTNLPLLKL